MDKLILHEDDVEEIRRLRRRAGQGTLIDASEAAVLLETTPDNVIVACHQGHLTPRGKTGRGKPILLEPSDVKSFARTYIFMTAIWRKAGDHVSVRRLAQLGVHPAGKAKKGLYFLRQDVERFLARTPSRSAQGERSRCVVAPSAPKCDAPDAVANL